MKKRLLACGICCGIVCALCVFLYTEMVYAEADSKRAEALQRYGGEQVDVLVATRDIHPGEMLDQSNCSEKTWLSDLLPQDAVLRRDDVQGKQITSLILQGEVVSKARFDNETKELNVPAGLVAIALPAADVQAVGGNLGAGSKVDVYATGSQTSCLGRELEVLATSAGNDEGSGRSKITWITLAVQPERAQEFVAASQSTQLYFTLPSAKTAEETKESTLETPAEQAESADLETAAAETNQNSAQPESANDPAAADAEDKTSGQAAITVGIANIAEAANE